MRIKTFVKSVDLTLRFSPDPQVFEGLKGPDLAALTEEIWPSIKEPLESGAMISVTEKSIRIKKSHYRKKNNL